MLLALIWKFDFPPFMVLIIAILNDGLYSLLEPTDFSSFGFCLRLSSFGVLPNQFDGCFYVDQAP